MPAFGDVDEFQISPNGQYVVYTADQETDGLLELYSVPINGSSPPEKLNGALFAELGGIQAFFIAPDSSRVVYVATQDTPGTSELYSAPIGGGMPVRLNEPLPPGGQRVRDSLVQISPDSSRVVYSADQDTFTSAELYSVPIAGGVVTKLNGPMPAGAQVFPDYGISADSSWVVSRGGQETDQVAELFSVPLAGGTVNKLSGLLPMFADVQGFEIGPHSGHVVYRADQDALQDFELYRVPIAGGPQVKLNDPLASGGDVQAFKIGPDGLHFVYTADQDTDEVIELYVAVVASGNNRLYLPAIPKNP